VAPLPRRVLGRRTRADVSMRGIGMAPPGGPNTTTAPAEAVVRAALDAGIICLDVSPDDGPVAG
jgi:aryl-alcohol dehydrogenase-like predicted oxidoreductase